MSTNLIVLAQSAPAEGGSVGPWLAIVGVLLVVNAALAGSEVALVSLREGQLTRLKQGGRAGQVLARLARDPNRFLSTIQIGITLSGFLSSATAAVALAEPLVPPLTAAGLSDGVAEPLAILGVTAVLTYVTLVLGELVPKRIALQRAERWGLAAARPLALLGKLTNPIVWILTKSTDLVMRLAGGDPQARGEEVSGEEIRDLVATQEAFSPAQRSIIDGAFEIAERTLREVLVPRMQVLAVDEHERTDEVVRKLVASGHSRAPVYRGNLDDVLGVVHLRDVVQSSGPVGEQARPATVLPETVGVLDALRRLQSGRDHMALVINEHGGAEGIVTLEDLLEEIVGEIYDEFDRDLDPTDVRGVERQANGALAMPGSFPMHDLHDVGVSLPEGDYATVAGLVLDRLGHIPEPGERLTLPGWTIEVLARDGNAIGRVRLVPQRDREPAAEG